MLGRRPFGSPQAIPNYRAARRDSRDWPAGFGLEMLADVTHGGAWHIGVLLQRLVFPNCLLAGREREFLADYAYVDVHRSSAVTDRGR